MRHQEFFDLQIKEWPLAQKNYNSQHQAVIKDFYFGEASGAPTITPPDALSDGCSISSSGHSDEGSERKSAPKFRVRLVCLPERIGSSSARITAKGQVDRPCFLCAHRLPPEQQSLPMDEDFSLLVNPFPVFPQHFTIPAVKHQTQRLRPYLSRLVHWTQTMDDMVLFYNGGRCGASAPDHLHFQAGNQGFMPMQSDFTHWKAFGSSPIYQSKYLEISELKDMLRQGWIFEAEEAAPLSQAIALFLDAFEYSRKDEIRERQNPICGNRQEPFGQNAGNGSQEIETDANGQNAQTSPNLEDEDDFLADDHVNLLCWYDKHSENQPFKAILFPRAKHRPSCYFEQDESRRRVTSPASVEMGGYYILPRREDFERMQPEELIRIYQEVCPSPTLIRRISQMALSILSNGTDPTSFSTPQGRPSRF